MKRYVLALAALVTLSAGAVTTAKAVEFNVGPGGVYVGQHRYPGTTGTVITVPTTDMMLGVVICGVRNAPALGAGPADTASACNGGKWL